MLGSTLTLFQQVHVSKAYKYAKNYELDEVDIVADILTLSNTAWPDHSLTR